eukprot:CAMPEP_0114427524 /NCGR_PEP_ID=MMETSP0103-20121206/8399_1 /TAXON_ID=37642 ORGANISM="Paraphysomonas imperforata, Strain PA2" /NCGR_SAMPLE_ID=MMETSP0103 /ASSEMBLY_ACC=CAM_ASM_000201 /LENGTH=482 /DNA_ID=CAMNT_0001596601 /DNA_START=81 /DNA_END=1529 /DNA_ORIENTATION=-
MDESADEEYFDTTNNEAKKKGFKNAVDFLQSRGIPLTNETVFLARSSSMEKVPSSSSPNKFSSPPATPQIVPVLYGDDDAKSPLQQYKDSRTADENFKSRPSLDRVRSQKWLTESLIMRKKAEKEANHRLAMKSNSGEEFLTVDTSVDSTSLRSFDSADSDNNKSYDEIVSEIGARMSRGSSRKQRTSLQGDLASAETTPQSNRSHSPMTKMESGEYSIDELKEDLCRMHQTIQELKDSNMKIAHERRFAEKMYQDEIKKLKTTLKAASIQIKADKEKVESLSTQLDEIQSAKISPEPSEMSSFQKPAKSTSSTPKQSLTPKPSSSSKPPIDLSSQIMVSVSTEGGIASEKSAADCANVDIDNIKDDLLKKFGWTEIEELESEKDENFTVRLYEEIRLLKAENKNLLDKLKSGNVDIGDIEKSPSQRPGLLSTPSKRRVYAQPGSVQSARRATVGTPSRRSIKDECAAVSVSSLKDKFLQES